MNRNIIVVVFLVLHGMIRISAQPQLSVTDLLITRFSEPMLNADCSTCAPRECGAIEGCDDSMIAAQTVALEDIRVETLEMIATQQEVACVINNQPATEMRHVLDMSKVNFPIEIVRVRLCSQEEVFVLAGVLDQLVGAYEIVDKLVFTSPDQQERLRIGEQVVQLNARSVLDLLFVTDDIDHGAITTEDYIQCGEEQCEDSHIVECTNDQVVLQDEALHLMQLNAADHIDYNHLSYPLTLQHISLCGGKNVWTLAREMQFIEHTNFSIIKTVTVQSSDEMVEVCRAEDGSNIEIDVEVQHPTCDFKDGGSIYITVQGQSAQGAITKFSVDGGETFQENPYFQNLEAGVYPVLVTNEDRTIISFDQNVLLHDPICAEICDNGIDDDGDGNIDCLDGDCGRPSILDVIKAHPGCGDSELGSLQIVASHMDVEYSIDGGVTFQTSASFENLEEGEYVIVLMSTHETYACDSESETVSLTKGSCQEICNNGIDDDGDGAIDGDDDDCDGSFALSSVNRVQPTTVNCPRPSDGQISITATGSEVLYSIDGGETFSYSSDFDNLFPGVYNVVIKNKLTEETLSWGGNPITLSTPTCVEICDNGIDDDGDGLADCEDDDCAQSGDASTEVCELGSSLIISPMASNQGILEFENLSQADFDQLITDGDVTRIDLVISYIEEYEDAGVMVERPREEEYNVYDGSASVNVQSEAWIIYGVKYNSQVSIQLKIGQSGLCVKECSSETMLAIGEYIDEVEIIEEDDPVIELPEFNCGDPEPSNDYDGSTTLDIASVGDVLSYQGFPLLLDAVTGSGGNFSGRATMPLPFNKRTVTVEYNLTGVNLDGIAGGGSITVLSDDGAGIDLTPSVFSIGGEICLPPPPPPTMTAEGIDPVTGLDAWGFDPVTGIHSGTMEAYDDQGFDINGIHKVTKNEYNQDGCNREGLDRDGGVCGTPPHVSDFIKNQGSDFGTGIQAAVQEVRSSLATSLAENSTACDAIRGQMDGLMTTLGFSREFIYGKQDEYYDEGMSANFLERPKELIVNVDRSKQVEDLEKLHQDLYDCDVVSVSIQNILISIDSAGLSQEELEQAITQRLNALDQQTIQTFSDPAVYNTWLQEQLDDILSSTKTTSDDIGYQLLDDRRPLKYEIPSLELVPDGIYGSIASSGNGHFGVSKQERIRGDIIFGLEQGETYINGVHRAFYLEKILKERKMRPHPMAMNGNVLPLEISKVIGGQKYSIILDQISFSTGGTTTVNAYMILEDPNNSERRLVFQAENVAFGPTGLKETSRMSLVSDIEIKLNNTSRLILLGDGSTYVEWDCSGFLGAHIEGQVEFCRNYILPLDDNGNVRPEPEMYRLDISLDVQEWLEFALEVDAGSFKMAKQEDITWTLNRMVIDMSAKTTPDINTPSGYNSAHLLSSSRLSPEWKGFYVQTLGATIPKEFIKEGQTPPKVSVNDLLIDGTGVSASLLYDPGSPIVPIEEGNMGGWAFSIDAIGVKVLQNQLAGGELRGQVKVPVFEEAMDYEAVMYPNNYYKFVVSPSVDYSMPLFLATANISNNSKVEISIQDGQVDAVATLSGSLTIDASGEDSDFKLNAPELAFCGFRVSNQAPYFSPGMWEIKGVGESNFGAFGLDISNIQPYSKDDEGDSTVGLGFDVELDLLPALGVSADGALGVLGYLSQDEDGVQEWKFKKIDVRGFSIDANIKEVVTVKGALEFFENDGVYGDGFQASLAATFHSINLEVEATGLFGDKDGLKYFFVDALTDFPISIGAGPVNIVGFGGGASYHMLPEFDVASVNFASGPVFTGALGESLSGAIYTPDPLIGLGLKATVLLATAKEEVFNGSLSLELLFNSESAGGGLHQITLLGNGHFLKALDKGIPPTSKDIATADKAPELRNAMLSAWLSLRFNFTEKSFAGDLAVFLDAGPLKGAGVNNKLVLASLLFSPDEWYINIGTPSDRAGAEFRIPIIGGVSITTYLNIGTNIPDFPELPPEVAQLANLVNTNESLRKSGGGFMFGAQFNADFKLDVFIASAELKAILGFDIMLRDYGDSMCAGGDGPIGIDGWYAAGQLYAFLEGKIKVFGINLLSAGVAAVLQTRLPNPFWAQATLAFRVKLLFISKTVRAKVAIGDACAIVGGSPSENIGLEVVMYSNPIDGAQGIDTDLRPEFFLGVPIKKNFKLEDDVYKVSKLEVFISTPDYEISWREEDQDDENIFRIIPNEILPGNTEITLTTKATVTKNGSYYDEEVKTFTFKTAEAIDIIPETNVEYTYPLDGQYDFHRSEYRHEKGFIKLVSGQTDLLTDDDGSSAIKVVLNRQGADQLELPHSYVSSSRRLDFEMPANMLSPTDMYELELKSVATDQILYKLLFRVSEYDKFGDKLDAIQHAIDHPVEGPLPRLRVKYGAFATVEDMEPIGEVTIYGNGTTAGLIESVADLDNNYYVGSNRMNWLIYDQFPMFSRICGSMDYGEDNRELTAGLRSIDHLTITNDIYHSNNVQNKGKVQAIYEAPKETFYHYLNLLEQLAECTAFEDFSEVDPVGTSDANLMKMEIELSLLGGITRSFGIVPGSYKILVNYTLPNNTRTTVGKTITITVEDE